MAAPPSSPIRAHAAQSSTEALMSDDPDETGKKVEKASTSCIADGLLMSRDGHLYITSPEDSSVRLWEGDRARTVVSDPRLRWPDSMAEAPDGSIYVTASRIQDSAWFNKDAPGTLPTKLFEMVKQSPTERADVPTGG
jgi:sugar lactone lactonase YvrE